MQPTKANVLRRMQLTALLLLVAGSWQMLNRESERSSAHAEHAEAGAVVPSQSRKAAADTKGKPEQINKAIANHASGAADPAESQSRALEALARWKDNPFPYTEQVEVVATGYFAGIESTGKTPGHPQYGITYSGVKVRKDTFSTIAADPAIFPIGTVLYIPGYGYGVVADTGSAIKGNKIDLYFETKDAIYRQWGKRNVKVNVLKRGDGKLSEAVLDQLNEQFHPMQTANP